MGHIRVQDKDTPSSLCTSMSDTFRHLVPVIMPRLGCIEKANVLPELDGLSEIKPASIILPMEFQAAAG